MTKLALSALFCMLLTSGAYAVLIQWQVSPIMAAVSVGCVAMLLGIKYCEFLYASFAVLIPPLVAGVYGILEVAPMPIVWDVATVCMSILAVSLVILTILIIALYIDIANRTARRSGLWRGWVYVVAAEEVIGVVAVAWLFPTHGLTALVILASSAVLLLAVILTEHGRLTWSSN